MLFPTLFVVPVFLIAALTLLGTRVKILRRYERAAVFTLGRFQKVRDPGLVLLITLSKKWCEWICVFGTSRSPARM